MNSAHLQHERESQHVKRCVHRLASHKAKKSAGPSSVRPVQSAKDPCMYYMEDRSVERILVLTDVWCDGSRPLCQHCRSRGVECVYATRDADETRQGALRRENEALRSRLQEYQKLVDDLTSVPAQDPSALLGSVRDNIHPNAEEPPRPYRTADYRILEQPLQLASLTRVRSNLEAELLLNHSKAYPKILAFENPQSIAERLLNPSESHRLDDIIRQSHKVMLLSFQAEIAN